MEPTTTQPKWSPTMPGSATNDMCSVMRSLRFHSVRLLRQIADSLEERQALGEEAPTLSVAGPRETKLLTDLLQFIVDGDMLEDEDLFACNALAEAQRIWPKRSSSPADGGEKLNRRN